MLGGVVFIVASILITSSQRSSTNECLQRAYVIKGLVLAFFAVGAFHAGSGLAATVLVTTPDAGYLAMGGWIFAISLLVIFLFGFNRSLKILQSSCGGEPGGVNMKADHWEKLPGPSLRQRTEFNLLGRVIRRGIN